MTAITPAHGAGAAPAPLRAADVENRKDSWLRQMELAQLESTPLAPRIAPPLVLTRPKPAAASPVQPNARLDDTA
ncbi:MAG TPA: hypothetical protein VIT92_01380, partial [Burkholderiaceae bacterium]